MIIAGTFVVYICGKLLTPTYNMYKIQLFIYVTRQEMAIWTLKW